MEKTTNGSLKEQCITEALAIIAEDGVRNLSIREVARRLGVSHGAPYRHFTNRDALITEIAIRGLAILQSYLTTGVEFEKKVPRANFMRMCQNYLRFAMEQYDYFQLILWTDLPRSTDEYPQLAAAANDVFELVFNHIRHVRRADVKDHQAMLMVFSTIHGYASLMSSGKLSVFNYSLDDLREHAENIAESLYQMLAE